MHADMISSADVFKDDTSITYCEVGRDHFIAECRQQYFCFCRNNWRPERNAEF